MYFLQYKDALFSIYIAENISIIGFRVIHRFAINVKRSVRMSIKSEMQQFIVEF